MLCEMVGYYGNSDNRNSGALSIPSDHNLEA